MHLDFQVVAYLTGLVLFVAGALAYVTTRDALHPMIYLAGMTFFLHAFLPLYFEMTLPDQLRGYFRQDDLDYAQTIAFLGALSLCGGVWWGAHGVMTPAPVSPVGLTEAARGRLVRAATALATLGLIAWIYMIIRSGGLFAVYGRPYGWFGADNGYVGEAYQFGLPAALLFLLARGGCRLRRSDLLWIGIALLPLLGHGLLGARRGPTFMALVGVGVMWYLARARRPQIGAAVLGGLAVGLLLLFLLANRDRIYLGAPPTLMTAGEAPTLELGPGNEFVFGAAAAVNAEAVGDFRWGRRYLIVLFVRPIPRLLWPNKYADAARALGMRSHENDTERTEFVSTLGWTGSTGSAPGGLFDLWIEFWWAYSLAVFVVGWGFGWAYRRALARGGFWLAFYGLVTALSIYFVMQGLSAFAFRALLLSAVMWLGWRYAMGFGFLARTAEAYPSGRPALRNRFGAAP